MAPSQLLHKALKENDLDFFVSVPCKLLSGLITLFESDADVIYTPVTREEEGIGLMAGAFLAGRRPAIMMQNSGVGNCVNAICSLVNYYRMAMVLVISHRGTEGEKIEAQRPMGAAVKDLLKTMSVPYYEIDHVGELGVLREAIEGSFRDERPVALLLPFSFWTGSSTSNSAIPG